MVPMVPDGSRMVPGTIPRRSCVRFPGSPMVPLGEPGNPGTITALCRRNG